MAGICRSRVSSMPIRRHPRVRVAVAIWHYASPVHVSYGSNLRHILPRTVNCVIDRKQMFIGERVRPLHRKRLPLANLEGGTRPHAVVAPHGREGKVAMGSMAESTDPKVQRIAGPGPNHRRN